jgi:iron complex outermembrane recepter protein
MMREPQAIRRLVLAGTCAAMAALAAASAAAEVRQAPDLRELSIEDLTQVEITSVSKKAEPIGEAPSSVYVITQRDLQSSGALNLAEALRLAPNLQVARLDQLSHVITARGFNSFATANKMLVLIDGRSVYSPLLAGVFWEAQNVMLEDLDRIEVISGPGGTLWGANAVNGVINVISRDAHDTQGGLVHGAAGDREQYLSARYGGALGPSGAFRVYAMGFRRDDTVDAPGSDDRFNGFQAGFRTDLGGARDAVTVQGDAYSHTSHADSGAFDDQADLTGGNILARWTRRLSPTSALQLQAYYDRARRSSDTVLSTVDTLDVQVQHSWLAGRHELVSGAGYRATHDDFTATGGFATDPQARWINLSHVFVQDEIALGRDLRLIAGLKLEHSSYSGAELLPNLRLAWTPSEHALLWAAVSRAVRTPSRFERDLVVPLTLVNGTFENEKLIAYEAGYRGSPLPRTSLSISVFYNNYTDLRTTEPDASAFLPLHIGNGMTGRTYGVEAWGSVDVMAWWRLSAGVSAMHKEFDLRAGSRDTSNMAAAGNDPSYQLMVRSQMEITDRLSLDLRARAVDDLPNPAVPAYIEADANIAYRLTDQVEVSLSGRNLLDNAHPETGEPAARGEAARSIFAGLRWTF